jgi:hypothetical protein
MNSLDFRLNEVGSKPSAEYQQWAGLRRSGQFEKMPNPSCVAATLVLRFPLHSFADAFRG